MDVYIYIYNQITCPMRVQYSKDWGWREKRAVPTPQPSTYHNYTETWENSQCLYHVRPEHLLQKGGMRQDTEPSPGHWGS